jgi:hypothetical protein
MNQEVPDEVQAAMSLKLEENVRDLVRRELKAALEDYSFIGGLNTFPLGQAITRNLNASDYNFQQAVKNVIAQQLSKY